MYVCGGGVCVEWSVCVCVSCSTRACVYGGVDYMCGGVVCVSVEWSGVYVGGGGVYVCGGGGYVEVACVCGVKCDLVRQ